MLNSGDREEACHGKQLPPGYDCAVRCTFSMEIDNLPFLSLSYFSAQNEYFVAAQSTHFVTFKLRFFSLAGHGDTHVLLATWEAEARRLLECRSLRSDEAIY